MWFWDRGVGMSWWLGSLMRVSCGAVRGCWVCFDCLVSGQHPEKYACIHSEKAPELSAWAKPVKIWQHHVLLEISYEAGHFSLRE